MSYPWSWISANLASSFCVSHVSVTAQISTCLSEISSNTPVVLLQIERVLKQATFRQSGFGHWSTSRFLRRNLCYSGSFLSPSGL